MNFKIEARRLTSPLDPYYVSASYSHGLFSSLARGICGAHHWRAASEIKCKNRTVTLTSEAGNAAEFGLLQLPHAYGLVRAIKKNGAYCAKIVRVEPK